MAAVSRRHGALRENADRAAGDDGRTRRRALAIVMSAMRRGRPASTGPGPARGSSRSRPITARRLPQRRARRDGDAGDVGGQRPRLILAICCFSLFMAQLDATVVNVGLPAIGRDLHAGIADLQWVVDAYVLGLASLVISAGAAGDRLGRRRVFRVGLVTFTLASLASGLAPSLGVLMACRLVQGAGASMLMPVTLSIISNTFRDARRRAEAIGVWAAVAGLSAAAGPPLGGALVDVVGWRAIFWVNLPIGALAIVLTGRFIPESRAPRPRPADMPGQALIAASISALTYALIQAPARGWTAPTTVALLAGAVAALAVFVAVELRASTPLVDVRLLRSPPLAGASVAAVLAYTALMGFLFLNSLYLQQVRGLSPTVAGLAILPFPAALVVTSPMAGRLVGRFGPRELISTGGGAIAAGMLALLTISPTTPYVRLLAFYLLLGSGWGLLNAPITNVAVSAMPAEQAGVASAIAGSARQIGAVLGVALLGSLTTTRVHGLLPRRLASLRISSHASTTPTQVHVIDATHGAFTSATHLGYLVGAVAALLIVPVAASTMRRRHDPAEPRPTTAGPLSPTTRPQQQ